jgi:hypothetical protein
VHEHFAGYLCLLRTAAAEGRTERLQPDFKEFFETFCRVAGAPPTAPYVKLFFPVAASEANFWYNKNPAGSYAPSSLRETSPIVRLATIESDGSYTLNPDHAIVSYRECCFEAKLPALDLAAFLYRDYALVEPNASAVDFIQVYREEFGLDRGDGASTFEKLFESPEHGDDAEWLEEI